MDKDKSFEEEKMNIKDFGAFTGIFVASMFLAVGVGFLIFHALDGGLTGFVIDDFSENVTVTREDALEIINESEALLEDVISRGFPGLFINESLDSAKRVFQQVDYAEILRNSSSSVAKKKEATKALRLVDWEDLEYSDVLVHTDEVRKRRDQVLRLSDLIEVKAEQFSDVEELGVTSVLVIFEEAKLAFNEGRYDEAESLLEEAREEYETLKLDLTVLASLKKQAQNVFQKYWHFMLLFLVLISIAGYFGYKRYEKISLEDKIKKMRVEQTALVKLIKIAQTERFKENKISESVYNIRMKKYQERRDEIKQQLPVFEARLRHVGEGKKTGKLNGFKERIKDKIKPKMEGLKVK